MENIHSLWFPAVITEFGATLEQKKQHFCFSDNSFAFVHVPGAAAATAAAAGRKSGAELSQQRPWGDCTGVGARTDTLLMLRGGFEVGLLCGAIPFPEQWKVVYLLKIV